MAIKTEKELGAALKNGESTIEIEGDLSKKVIRIKATGKLAWAIGIAAIGVAVVATIAAAPSGGSSLAAHGLMAPAAAAALGGPSVAASALMIAVAAGGIGGLNKLRKYSMSKKADGRVVLTKKR